MGRTMLMVVILMSTLYAGIMTTMQRRLLSLPNIINRNMLSKQAESVSDYALRTAVRNSVALGMMAGDQGLMIWQTNYNNFNLQNCKIDSIKYTFTGQGDINSYRAISYVSGSSIGQTINYRSEIAFSFPVIQLLDIDYCIYLDVNQPAFNPNFNMVYDVSDNENDAYYIGNVDTRPHGSGVDGWKCASFNESSGGTNGYIYHPGNASMTVASEFSMMGFIKINQNWPAATLYWMPPDPTDPCIANNGLSWNTIRKIPTGGIWYQNGRIYYTATTVYGQTVQTSTAYTPDGKWPHNKDAWDFVGLTYNKGQLKGYLNGACVGTTSSLLYPLIKPNAIRNKGLWIGREYYGYAALQSGEAWHYMYGLMDQIGLAPRALSESEMISYYNMILNPAEIQYIRD